MSNKAYLGHMSCDTCSTSPTSRHAAQRPALEDALRQLYILGAIDVDGHITGMGRRMAALPVEPSVARTLIAAAELHCLPDALTVAAMLSAETIFSGNRHAAD